MTCTETGITGGTNWVYADTPKRQGWAGSVSSKSIGSTDLTLTNGSGATAGQISPAKDSGAIAAYIDWCRSDEGQAVVKDVGYFPLPKNLR